MSKCKKNNNQKEVKIPKDVKSFSEMTAKKYRKERDLGRKEAEKRFPLYLVESSVEAIEFLVKNGHIRNEKIQELKSNILDRIASPVYVETLTKSLKKKELNVDDFILLPIINREVLIATERQNRELVAADPNAKIYDMTSVVNLNKLILKKKIKKYVKAGISEKLALDILTVVPTKGMLDVGRKYRIKCIYDAMYERAKTDIIDVSLIMEEMIPSKYYPDFIIFALLERKDKFTNLSDSQKTAYLQITNWCLDTMEKSMTKDAVEKIISVYASCRQRDDSLGKDGNRRYALTSLLESDYPKISKIVARLTATNATIQKYL